MKKFQGGNGKVMFFVDTPQGVGAYPVENFRPLTQEEIQQEEERIAESAFSLCGYSCLYFSPYPWTHSPSLHSTVFRRDMVKMSIAWSHNKGILLVKRSMSWIPM